MGYPFDCLNQIDPAAIPARKPLNFKIGRTECPKNAAIVQVSDSVDGPAKQFREARCRSRRRRSCCASRLRVGEDLPDIARMLCIRCPYLKAIEDGRYDDLPGSTYAAGFVRSYAEHLGLDADEVVRRFRVETSDKQTATRLDFPVPVHESGVPSGAVLFIGLLIAAVGYGLWFVSTGEDNPFAGIVSRVPGDMAAGKKSRRSSRPEPNPGGMAIVESRPGGRTLLENPI